MRKWVTLKKTYRVLERFEVLHVYKCSLCGDVVPKDPDKPTCPGCYLPLLRRAA